MTTSACFFPTKPKRIYGTARNSSFAATSYMLLCAGYTSSQPLLLWPAHQCFGPAHVARRRSSIAMAGTYTSNQSSSHTRTGTCGCLFHIWPCYGEFRHSSCCAWQYYRRLWSSTLMANCFARLRPFPNSHSLPTGLASSRLSSCLHCVNQTGCKCRTSQLCTRYPISTFFPPFEWKDLLRTTTCRFAFE